MFVVSQSSGSSGTTKKTYSGKSSPSKGSSSSYSPMTRRAAEAQPEEKEEQKAPKLQAPTTTYEEAAGELKVHKPEEDTVVAALEPATRGPLVPDKGELVPGGRPATVTTNVVTVEEAWSPEYAKDDRVTTAHISELLEENEGDRRATAEALIAEGVESGKAWNLVRGTQKFLGDVEKGKTTWEKEFGRPENAFVQPYESEKVLEGIRTGYQGLIDLRAKLAGEAGEIYDQAYDTAIREWYPGIEHGKEPQSGGAWMYMGQADKDQYHSLQDRIRQINAQIANIGQHFETQSTPSSTMPGRLLGARDSLTMGSLQSFTGKKDFAKNVLAGADRTWVRGDQDALNAELEKRYGFEMLPGESPTNFAHRMWLENVDSVPEEQVVKYQNDIRDFIERRRGTYRDDRMVRVPFKVWGAPTSITEKTYAGKGPFKVSTPAPAVVGSPLIQGGGGILADLPSPVGLPSLRGAPSTPTPPPWVTGSRKGAVPLKLAGLAVGSGFGFGGGPLSPFTYGEVAKELRAEQPVPAPKWAPGGFLSGQGLRPGGLEEFMKEGMTTGGAITYWRDSGLMEKEFAEHAGALDKDKALRDYRSELEDKWSSIRSEEIDNAMSEKDTWMADQARQYGLALHAAQSRGEKLKQTRAEWLAGASAFYDKEVYKQFDSSGAKESWIKENLGAYESALDKQLSDTDHITLTDPDTGKVMFSGGMSDYKAWRSRQSGGLGEIGKNFGMSMIPVYGTIQYGRQAAKDGWTPSEVGWMAASVGGDIAMIVPPLGAAAKAAIPVRAGVTAGRASIVARTAASVFKIRPKLVKPTFKGVLGGLKTGVAEYGKALAYPFRHRRATIGALRGLSTGKMTFPMSGLGVSATERVLTPGGGKKIKVPRNPSDQNFPHMTRKDYDAQMAKVGGTPTDEGYQAYLNEFHRSHPRVRGVAYEDDIIKAVDNSGFEQARAIYGDDAVRQALGSERYNRLENMTVEDYLSRHLTFESPEGGTFEIAPTKGHEFRPIKSPAQIRGEGFKGRWQAHEEWLKAGGKVEGQPSYNSWFDEPMVVRTPEGKIVTKAFVDADDVIIGPVRGGAVDPLPGEYFDEVSYWARAMRAQGHDVPVGHTYVGTGTPLEAAPHVTSVPSGTPVGAPAPKGTPVGAPVLIGAPVATPKVLPASTPTAVPLSIASPVTVPALMAAPVGVGIPGHTSVPALSSIGASVGVPFAATAPTRQPTRMAAATPASVTSPQPAPTTTPTPVSTPTNVPAPAAVRTTVPAPIVPFALPGALGGGGGGGGGYGPGYRPKPLGLWVMDYSVSGVHPLTGKLVKSKGTKGIKYGAVESNILKSRTLGGRNGSSGRLYKTVTRA